jgi:hypothetical protein
MTNVMAWLAARSLRGTQTAPADDGAPMPAVRPRLPNRYERDAAQAPAQDLEREDDYTEAVPVPVPRRDALPSVPERRVDPEQPPARPRAMLSPPVEASDQHALLHQQPKAQSEPVAKNRPDLTTAPAQPPPAAVHPKNQPASLQPIVPQATVPTAPPVLDSTPQDGRDRPPPRPAPRDQFEGSARMQERTAIDPVAPPLSVRPILAPAVPPAPVSGVVRVSPATPRQAAPLRDPKPTRDQSATLAAAPPRVQVTIGRLEIRAATAQPAPSRQPAEPTPAKSLDDYLADRGKG